MKNRNLYRGKLMQDVTFRKIKVDETSKLFDLILDRMKWMDQAGIVHWNKYEYDKVYPLSYYEEKCREGQVYGTGFCL